MARERVEPEPQVVEVEGWAYEDREEEEQHGLLKLSLIMLVIFAGLVGVSAFTGLQQMLEVQGGLSSWVIAGCLATVIAIILATI